MIRIGSPKLWNVSATEEDERTSQETEEYEEDIKRKPLKTTGMRSQGRTDMQKDSWKELQSANFVD
jgi:hypothetical protein